MPQTKSKADKVEYDFNSMRALKPSEVQNYTKMFLESLKEKDKK